MCRKKQYIWGSVLSAVAGIHWSLGTYSLCVSRNYCIVCDEAMEKTEKWLNLWIHEMTTDLKKHNEQCCCEESQKNLWPGKY